ncbi:mesoderm induction early response protein 1-like isoform X3 [Anneissia japonica]|uniref:mesoderm induction early response protein 1-like isoform X3 n=1 Tax=Anneissia japonica TaxID=1529436 RepID=UPI0014257E85|nr:mesoderm induction early response protein 1-like isoform X3 [Anneissia japonica]
MGDPTVGSDSSPEGPDRDFEMTADMMVHDYDDEGTLEDEENQEGSDSAAKELNDLEKDAEIPMDELMAMYCGRQDGSPQDDANSTDNSTDEILETNDLTLDKEEIGRDLLPNDDNNLVNDAGDEDADELHSDFFPDHNAESLATARLLRSTTHHTPDDEEDSCSEDSEYIPQHDWKKEISVGEDFQAVIPDGLCPYDDAPAYENEDRLLWDPSKLDDSQTESYLRQVQVATSATAKDLHAVSQGAHTRDDEKVLYVLLQCGYNIEEALRRHKMQIAPITDEMSLWSEDECRFFESGLRSYGKNFHLIKLHKVQTRSVGELVQFYYLWKKTARHDVFANQTRISKKKYHLHPGITDYMDRFLDDPETIASPTPAQCLMDNIRQIRSSNMDGASIPELQAGEVSPEPGGLPVSNLPLDDVSLLSVPSLKHPRTEDCDEADRTVVKRLKVDSDNQITYEPNNTDYAADIAKHIQGHDFRNNLIGSPMNRIQNVMAMSLPFDSHTSNLLANTRTLTPSLAEAVQVPQ